MNSTVIDEKFWEIPIARGISSILGMISGTASCIVCIVASSIFRDAGVPAEYALFDATILSFIFGVWFGFQDSIRYEISKRSLCFHFFITAYGAFHWYIIMIAVTKELFMSFIGGLCATLGLLLGLLIQEGLYRLIEFTQRILKKV